MNLADRLPADAVLVGYVASIKFLDANGELCLLHVSSDVPAWEALGMVTSARDDIRTELQAND